MTKNIVLIGIYIDDCLVIGKDDKIQRVIKDLKTKGFNLKIQRVIKDLKTKGFNLKIESTT
jgi:uncharacterized protein (UPF0335 family)